MGRWFKTLVLELVLGPRRIVDALFGYDFFISYAHADGDSYPKALDEALGKTYTVHLDTRDFAPGKDLRLLSRIRVRNSRLLVVVGQPNALTSSYWVRREVEIFQATGREPVIVDVDGAVEHALVNPPTDSLAAWIAANRVIRPDGPPINPMLLEVDAVPLPESPRLPRPHVAERLEKRFTGDRVETRRHRIVVAVLGILLLATGLAIWQAIDAENQREAALLALAESRSVELAARARVEVSTRPDLAAVLAQQSIEFARANNVSWTTGAAALRDIMAETRGVRAFCLQRGEGSSIDFAPSKRLLAVGTDDGSICLFRRERDGALTLIDALQNMFEWPMEMLQFSEDGDWLISQKRGGWLRALHVGVLYPEHDPAPRGESNYGFFLFGTTDVARAVSFDSHRARIAFFSRETRQLEIWKLTGLDPKGSADVVLKAPGEPLATAFDPSGQFFAALVLDAQWRRQPSSESFWQPDLYRDVQENFKLRLVMWRLDDWRQVDEFEVMPERREVYFGDGISMGSLRGSLRLGPGAKWIAPAMFLADQHSLEPRMAAQVLRAADKRVVANFFYGKGERSFDGWNRVTDIGFSPDGKAFYALNDSIIRFWSLPETTDGASQRVVEFVTPSAQAGARKSRGVVSAISLSADGRLLATLDSTNSMAVWDVSAERSGPSDRPAIFVEGLGDGHSGTPQALAFTRDTEEVFFAVSNGEVRACNLRTRCGPIAPRQIPVPDGGGQWKQILSPPHGQWIAAVSEKQIVNFFRPSDVNTAILSAAVSDEAAPVITRSYAILSGVPGRPVAVVPSSDGAWAAIYERAQYGSNSKLRLVKLSEPPDVFDVTLPPEACGDGSFTGVEFDEFSPTLAVFSRSGCISLVHLPSNSDSKTLAAEVLSGSSDKKRFSSIIFRKDFIVTTSEGTTELWERESNRNNLGRLIHEIQGGELQAAQLGKHLVFTRKGEARDGQALVAAEFSERNAIQWAPLGRYNEVTTAKISPDGAFMVVVGRRADKSGETVAVWDLNNSRDPFIEAASDLGRSEPSIVFSWETRRIFLGPTKYKLKDSWPDPESGVGILVDLRARLSRPIKIQFGYGKESCTSSGGSCFKLDYVLSNDGKWLGVTRDETFGPPGMASVLALDGVAGVRIEAAAAGNLEFDPKSELVVMSGANDVRSWRLDGRTGRVQENGRLAGRSAFGFAASGREVLMLTAGEVSLAPLEIGDLMSKVGEFVGRNLSPGEWERLLPWMPYRDIFPSFPPNAERIQGLLDRATVLERTDRKAEASAAFEEAAKLAVATESVFMNDLVAKAAMKAGLGQSAKVAAAYLVKVLPKDEDIPKRYESILSP